MKSDEDPAFLGKYTASWNISSEVFVEKQLR